MSLWNERAEAVRHLLAEVRSIETVEGVSMASLDKIGEKLIGLATRTELFPPEHFPIGSDGGIYRVSEDSDHRFTLYASAGKPGKKVPPHNHTTWAIIAGVHGEEHNTRYARADNSTGIDREVKLQKGPELTVRKGNCITYLPDDFHTIETPSSSPYGLHLHLYGLSLERLPDRVTVDLATGRAERFMAKPKILTPMISVADVKKALGAGDSLAFLDAREEGEFSSDGHPLFAIPLPLSRLELRAGALLPDPAARIVLMDSGEEGQWQGRANRAAAQLMLLGYTNVAVMAGGLKAWREAGHEVFTGVNVPSKAFGEVVEHDHDTPRIDAADLQKLVDEGRDLVILDSRPIEEFTNMSIPGGIDCPGAELVYRVKDLAPDPKTLVVVNCAGRTRSIIGAQSLINAGLPNRVMALKNGTMGWHLAGLEVARGKTQSFGPQGPEAAKFAQQAAARVAAKVGVRSIDRAALERLEVEEGTLYRYDVRDPAEYAAGHLRGFRNAPGGQLVQATDQYVAVRGATIVLHDNDGVRATMTAHWLIQMGWDKVFVLKHAAAADEMVGGAEPAVPLGTERIDPAVISAAELKARGDRGEVLLVDLDTSLRYRDGHIPGAWFAVRANLTRTLPEMLAQSPTAKRVVFTSPDGLLARYAAAEAAELTELPVAALWGGTAAWRDAKLPLERGQTRMADAPTDVWYRPYDRKDGIEAAMHQYLDWEVDLVAQVERDGDARFGVVKI
jgi:rhodanese-related sulfurtransferase